MLRQTIKIIRQVWRGHVKLVPWTKSNKVIGASAGKCSKPDKESYSAKELADRAKAQRIIDYVFGKGEYPFDDLTSQKNNLDVHRDRLAQTVAPQVHENKEHTHTVKDRTTNDLPTKIMSPTLNAGEHETKNTRAQEPEDTMPAVSGTDYYESEQMTGADRAEAVKIRTQKCEKLEEKPRVVPVYPGHIKRLYCDPYINDVNKTQTKICKEINNILNKHEKELDKGTLSFNGTTKSEINNTNKRLFNNQLKGAEGPSRRSANLSRFEPHGRPFVLHQKLQANLKKHMAAIKTKLVSDVATCNDSGRSANKTCCSKSNVRPKTAYELSSEIKEKTIESPVPRRRRYSQRIRKPISPTYYEADALISDIKSKGVPLIDEDISKKVDDISQQTKEEKQTEPHSPPLNASTAGIMYSETSSSAQTFLKPSPFVIKKQTSRFENPKDLDVDIEPIHIVKKERSSSKEQFYGLRNYKLKPVSAIQETLDIARTVVEKSENKSNAENNDVTVNVDTKNCIECPISKIDLNNPDIDKEYVNLQNCKIVMNKNNNITKYKMDTTRQTNLGPESNKDIIEHMTECKAASKENIRFDKDKREIITEPVMMETETPKFRNTIVPASLKTETNSDWSAKLEATPSVSQVETNATDSQPSSVSAEPEESLTSVLEKIRDRQRIEELEAPASVNQFETTSSTWAEPKESLTRLETISGRQRFEQLESTSSVNQVGTNVTDSRPSSAPTEPEESLIRRLKKIRDRQRIERLKLLKSLVNSKAATESEEAFFKKKSDGPPKKKTECTPLRTPCPPRIICPPCPPYKTCPCPCPCCPKPPPGPSKPKPSPCPVNPKPPCCRPCCRPCVPSCRPPPSKSPDTKKTKKDEGRPKPAPKQEDPCKKDPPKDPKKKC